MKCILLIITSFFLLVIAGCAIGLIICGIKLLILDLKDMKQMNKKGYIHPSMYNKNYREPQRTVDRILHRY